VYYPYLGKDIKEDTKLLTESPADAEGDEKLEYDYGVMKTNPEFAAQNAFGKNRTIIVRPTYMIGPADRTDRFAYWPVRLKRGGEVMVPGKADDAVQYIDVRDVAEFMIRLIEQRTAGTYNGAGPASAQGMHAFIHAAHAAFSSPLEIVAIDDYEFLKKQNVHYIVPWIMPEGKNFGSSLTSNQHSIANGLTFRPLARTVWDIDEWWESDAVSEERREKLLSGLMDREEAIIRAWKGR
jgi:2'-hydroxyisoflavone reductase